MPESKMVVKRKGDILEIAMFIGKIMVGNAAGHIQDGQVKISHIFTKEGFGNRGIASKIIREAERIGKGNVVFLDSVNITAREMLPRRGYEEYRNKGDFGSTFVKKRIRRKR